MATEEQFYRDNEIAKVLRALSPTQKRYNNYQGATAPDLHGVIHNTIGVLTRLEVSPNEDDYRLILAMENLAEEQVEAILTIVRAVVPQPTFL